jgi:hypothetical protein
MARLRIWIVLLRAVQAWVLVSKEGRITLLGGLDLDPSRTQGLATMQFKKEGKRQWELAYEDSTRATLSRFIIANADGKRLFSVDAIGTTEVEGETLIIGPLGSNTSQAFFGRHRAWRLYKGIFDGGGADERSSMTRACSSLRTPSTGPGRDFTREMELIFTAPFPSSAGPRWVRTSRFSVPTYDSAAI